MAKLKKETTLKKLERIEGCIKWCAYDGKTTGVYKKDFDAVRREVKAYNQVSVLMKKYGIKDINELEQTILNEGSHDAASKEYYEYYVKPLEKKAKAFALLNDHITFKVEKVKPCKVCDTPYRLKVYVGRVHFFSCVIEKQEYELVKEGIKECLKVNSNGD